MANYFFNEWNDFRNSLLPGIRTKIPINSLPKWFNFSVRFRELVMNVKVIFRNTCRNVEFYLITFRIQKSLTIITFLLCTKNHVVFTYYMDVFFMKIHVFPRCKKSFNGVKSRQFSEKKVSLKLAKQYSFWQIIALHSNASTRIMKISQFVSLLPCVLFRIPRSSLEIIIFLVYSIEVDQNFA